MKFLKWFGLLGIIGCWSVYMVAIVLNIWIRKPFQYTYSDIMFTSIILGFGLFLPIYVFAKVRGDDW